jgi:hypothetical protein
MESGGTRPRLPALWPWLVLCAIAALWIDLGEYHRYHTSDSILPVLTSLYKWTPYYWECNRIGMLVPLLAIPFKNPMMNLLVQGWLVLFAAFASLFLLPRWVLRTPAWPVVGAAAAEVFVLLSSRERLFVNTMGQAHYAVGLALGLGALMLTERPCSLRSIWRRLPGAVALALLAHWVNSATIFFLAPLVLLRGVFCRRAVGDSPVSRFPCRPEDAAPRQGAAALFSRVRGILDFETVVALGTLAVGAIGCGAARALTPCWEDPVSNGLASWRQWPSGCVQLAFTTWRDAFSPYWIGYLALSGAACLVIAIPTLRRQAGTPLMAALSLLAGGLGYGLLMGSLQWVAHNQFCYKYMIPVIFFIDVALAAVIVGPVLACVGPRRGKALTLAAAPALVLVLALVHGVPSRARARAEFAHMPWDPALYRRTDDLLELRATHAAGTYAQVWMSVFLANLALYERGEDRVVWGVAGRCIPTWSTWGRMHPQDVRIAAFAEAPGKGPSAEANYLLDYFFPPLTAIEKRERTWLLRPTDEVLPLACGPILLSWHSGFFGPQALKNKPNCLCGTNSGKLTLTNPTDQARPAQLEVEVIPSDLLPGRLWVDGPGFVDEIRLGGNCRLYRKTLNLPPGKTTLRLSCDSRRTPVLADQMNIIFHVPRFAVTEIRPQTELAPAGVTVLRVPE